MRSSGQRGRRTAGLALSKGGQGCLPLRLPGSCPATDWLPPGSPIPLPCPAPLRRPCPLPAVIVCALAAVSSMVTGVVVGVLGLAEALPQSAGAALVRLFSWVCILLGVAGEQPLM